MPGRPPIEIFNGALIPGTPEKPMLASTLLLVAVDTYGGSVLLGDDETRWSPHTIEMEINQDAGGLVDAYFGKLMAACEMMTTDHFTTSLPDFMRLCNTLCESPGGDSPDWADADEMAWALTEYVILNGSKAHLKFHPEIAAYTRKKLLEEGFTRVPSILDKITGSPGEVLIPPGSDRDLSEDPEMAADSNSNQAGLAQAVYDYVSERVQLLLQQIGLMALSSPVMKDWKQNVVTELHKVLTSDESDTA